MGYTVHILYIYCVTFDQRDLRIQICSYISGCRLVMERFDVLLEISYSVCAWDMKVQVL